MWIVAIAWIYVVALMAVTETSIVAGVMTFVFYCAIPLSILYYLTGSKKRRLRRAGAGSAGPDSSASTESGSGTADLSPSDSGDSGSSSSSSSSND